MASRRWEELKGQIYLGSHAFYGEHTAPEKRFKEIPQAEVRAASPLFAEIFAKSGKRGKRAIAEALDQGYRLDEIAVY